MALSKRVFSFIVVLAICISSLSGIGVTVHATTSHLTSVPEGYVGIYTKDDLDNIKLGMSGKYILMNDICFNESDYVSGGSFYNSGKGWAPIGTSSNAFKGVLDGNGYTISNLYINDTSRNYVGLFGYINDATIKNLTLDNFDISGKEYVGGVAGYSYHRGHIYFCNTSGTIKGNKYVGGLVGYQQSLAGCGDNCTNSVYKCNNAASVSAGTYAGGISGFAESNRSTYHSAPTYIFRCSNTGSVSANSCAGGIVAISSDDVVNGVYTYQYVTNCYNIGDVDAQTYAGGLIGKASGTGTVVTNSYSIGSVSAEENWGGCFGTAPKENTACYYYEKAVVNPTCTVSTPKSEDQLKKQTTFEQWDFDSVWTMAGRSDYSYPELAEVPLMYPEDYIKHEHSYTSEITKPATHLTTGTMLFVCECGDTYTKTIQKLTEHNYKSVVTKPTCTEGGYTTYTCECGYSYSDNYVSSSGHTSSGWIIDKKSSCISSGSKHTECITCGEILENVVIPSQGHSSSDWITDRNATCTASGTKHRECVTCGETLEISGIVSMGHSSSGWITDRNPTCTVSGTEHRECIVCGETIETATIPSTGHTEVKLPATAPTCTGTGKTEGSNCSVCNTVIEAQTIIPAKGHTSGDWIFENETRVRHKECIECGDVLETEVVPMPTTKLTSCYNEVKGVQLKWNAVSGAESYKVYRKLPSQTEWVEIKSTTDLAYQDNNVTGNTVYQYSVKVVDQYGNESDYSPQRECRFIETPQLLSRTNDVGGVTIKWKKVAGATSYRIYRRGAGVNYWYYLGDFPATLDTFTDLETANYFPDDAQKNALAKPKSGNYYRYTVRASYDGKDSAGKDYTIYSGFDTNGLYLKYVATPKLTSISNATDGLQIKWNAVAGGGPVEYRVYRRGAGSTYWYYLGTTTNTTWTDSGVKVANGGYYRYTVRAVAGKDGKGWYSAFDTTGLYLMRLANPTLTSAVSSSAGITVKWGAIKGTTSYYVYRKTANSGWTRIAAVGGTNTTTYLDKTAKKGTTYTYTVRAVYGATTSAYNAGISCYDKY